MKEALLKMGGIVEMLPKEQMKQVMGGLEKLRFECISDDYDPIAGTGSSTTTTDSNPDNCDGTLHQHP